MVSITFMRRMVMCSVLFVGACACAGQKAMPEVQVPLSEEEAMMQQLKQLTPEQLGQLENDYLNEMFVQYGQEAQRLSDSFWQGAFRGLVAGALLNFWDGASLKDQWNKSEYALLGQNLAAWLILAQAGLSCAANMYQSISLSVKQYQQSEAMRAEFAKLRVAAGADSLN
jgi:hypothetical protein